MNLAESTKSSFKNIRTHKLRAFLTMLGMIIGIAAVITIISIGAGAESLIVNQIESAGSNLIAVIPGAADENGPPASVFGITVTTLKYEDALALRNPQDVPHAEAVAAYVQGTATVQWRNRDVPATFVGTTASYLDVEETDLAAGRFFDESDDRGLSRTVVLGSRVAEDLFEQDSPIGKNIKIKRESFRVIGVMKERGTAFFVNQDDQVFVPLQTAQKLLLGINHISFIRLKVDDPGNVTQTTLDMKRVLRERHEITDPDDDDFLVRSTQQAQNILGQVTDALRFFLVAIAGIALLVGGIGIMNIMLVAVNERIHEIGLRKAVGATSGNILSQFLVETVVTSLIGGVIGVVLGTLVSLAVALVVNSLGFDWRFVLTFGSVVLSAGFSVGVGLIFGIYPAWKASKLDPITALRYE